MEAFLIFPKMSNVASPPAEPGVYLMANYFPNFDRLNHPRLTTLSLFTYGGGFLGEFSRAKEVRGDPPR